MQYEMVKTWSIKTWYCKINDVTAGYQKLKIKYHYMIITRIHPNTHVVLVRRVFSLPIFKLHSKWLAISPWMNYAKVTRVP